MMSMNLITIQLVCVLSLIGISVADNINIPVITDIEQQSEDSVRIKWTFSSLNYLLRYRVEISSDNFEKTTYEWPAQLHKIISDTNGPVIDSFKTRSNFDCYNECIRNPFCYTARVSRRASNCTLGEESCDEKPNCFLKGKYDSEDRDLSSDFMSERSRVVARINDFENNEAFVYNLPYNYAWQFRVSIFDQTSGKWSKFSSATPPLDTKVSLQIALEQHDLTSLKISWRQAGQFKTYNISRYIVQVSINGDPFVEYFDTKNMTAATLSPSYFDPNLPEPILNQPTEHDCFLQCIEINNCVQFVYDAKGKKCYLITRMNPAIGIEDHNITVKSIQSLSTGYLIKNLKVDSHVKVKVDYITPYGTRAISDIASLNFGDPRPVLSVQGDPNNFNIHLNWKPIEGQKIKSYTVQYSVNGSEFQTHLEASFFDYEDPHEVTFKSNLTECYDSCMKNTACRALSWSSASGGCHLKSNFTQRKNCNVGTVCASFETIQNKRVVEGLRANTKYCYRVYVDTYSGIRSESSNVECFKWNVTVTNHAAVKDFKANRSTMLKCNLQGISIGQVQSLKWFKNNITISKLNSPGLTINYKEMTLELKNLSHLTHNGEYFCELELKNNKKFASKAIDVKVKFKPVMEFSGERTSLVTLNKRPLNLTCVVEGYPLPEIKWFFNSRPLTDAFTESKEGEARLKSWLYFDTISLVDAGEYKCQVVDTGSKKLPLSRVFNVMLDHEPQFLTSARNYTVDEHESVEFVCAIVQKQKERSRLVWRKRDENVELLEASEVYEVDDRYTSILKLEKVNRSHIGMYECFLEDKPHYLVPYGLIVRFASYLLDANQHKQLIARQNHNIDIECTAVGNPVEKITWKRHYGANFQYLTPDHLQIAPYNITSSLSLTNLSRKDSGNYSCHLPDHNLKQNKKKTFSLLVKTIPSEPIITDIQLRTRNLIKIFWYLADDGGASIQTVFLEWAANFTVSPSDIHNVTVSLKKSGRSHAKNYVTKFEVHLPTRSSVRITVQNSMGRSPPSKMHVLPSTSNAISNTKEQSKASPFASTSVRIVVIVSVVLVVFLLIIAFIIKQLKKIEKANREIPIYKKDSKKSRNYFIETSTIKADNISSISDVDSIRLSTSTSTTTNTNGSSTNGANITNKLTLQNSTLIESFEITSPELFRLESEKVNRKRAQTHRLKHHNTLNSHDAKDCKRRKRKSRSFSNMPISHSDLSDSSELKDSYSVQTLLKRCTIDSDTLDRDLHFEFLEIRNYPANKSFKDSLKIPNERKSRYKYIYPYDDNRVRLRLMEGRPDSDFINASYIQGYKRPRKFIAAQGATKATAADFLRMIVEKEVTIVVMLTQIHEGDVLKCWPYWSDTKALQFGAIASRVITLENRVFYEKRLIEIKYMERETVIEHYYYKEWPDKSCPIEAQSILNLINKINIKCSLFDSSPILVHCSAGIGRTGTFIAISNLIEMMQDMKKITPKRVVTDIRKQRAFLVQNWEQYKFIHQAVLEWCLFNSTLVNIDNRGLCKFKLADPHALKAEFWNMQKVNRLKNRNVYSYESIIESDNVRFDPEENYSIDQTNKGLDANLVLVQSPLYKAELFLTLAPKSKNAKNYVEVLFKLRPLAIVSTADQESFHLVNFNGRIRSKTRIPGFLIYCKENEEFKPCPNDNVSIYDMEVINVNTKSTFSTIYVVVKSLQSDEDDTVLNTQRTPLVRFICSLVKILDVRISKSDMNTKPRIIFQANESPGKCSENELATHAALFFMLKNVFKSREFDIVQTVRLLQNSHHLLFSSFEYYKFLYDTCCSDEIFNTINQLR